MNMQHVKEVCVAQGTNERMARLLAELQQFPGQVEQLPGQEGDIVRAAMQGQGVYELAQNYRLTEAAVWNILSNVVQGVTGRPARSVETAGLGSDTDPGVTGGYGDTSFGSLGNEPPMPAPEEPDKG
jgi:hypothetical protein